MAEVIEFGRRKDDFEDLEPLHPRMEIMIAQMEQLYSERANEHRTESLEAKYDGIYQALPELIHNAVATAFAKEETNQDIKDRKHSRKRDKTFLAMAKIAFWFSVIMCGIAIALTVLNGLDFIHISDSVLLAMFALGAVLPILAKFKSPNSN